MQSQQQQADVRTLWVGDLQHWMDEKYLTSIFGSTGELVSTKVIRNKSTGYSEGYGFVEFATHACAETMMHSLAGTQMPHSDKAFRLNWAFAGAGERKQQQEWGPWNTIFVGDLAHGVTDAMLAETFRRYSSVTGAKVVIDPASGRAKGYGFVRFGDEGERQRALVEMNGVYCSTRPMRINAATPRKGLMPPMVAPMVVAHQAAPPPPPPPPMHKVVNPGLPAPVPAPVQTYAPVQNIPPEFDPNNKTIFVEGLHPAVKEEELQKIFGSFGEIVYVNIMPGGNCALIRFTLRPCAEAALHNLQGATIHQQAMRLSWGRSANKQGWNAYGYGYDAAQGSNQGGYPGYMPADDSHDDPPNVSHDSSSLESFDPMAPPDIDALNAAYVSLHEPFLLGRHLRMRMREQAQQA